MGSNFLQQGPPSYAVCFSSSSKSGCFPKGFTDIRRMRRKLKFALLTIVWIGAVALGLHALMAYKAVPGSASQTPATWPENHTVSLSKDNPLLVMFAHPRCPCTKASITELNLLMAQAKGQVDAAVVFYEPENDSADWTNSASIEMTREIPGVRIITDPEGRLAKQFGVETSGHTIVYSPTGKLLFSGGITGSRGHAGDNAGFDSVLHVLRNREVTMSPASAQVFGCSLFEKCTNEQQNK
jgi:hypothetical protein